MVIALTDERVTYESSIEVKEGNYKENNDMTPSPVMIIVVEYDPELHPLTKRKK